MISITLWRAAIGNYYNSFNKYRNGISPFACTIENHLSKFISIYFLIQIIIFGIFALFCLGYFYAINIFNSKFTYLCSDRHILNYHIKMLHIFQLFLLSKYLLLCGDIELNPGPRETLYKYLSIVHWNLNSVIAHDYSKLDLLRAFNDIHKFDIICLSETYLDSTFSLDHRELLIDNYTMVRSDHPVDVRRGGVCIYYKKC